MLPGFTFTLWLPTSTTLSGLTVEEGAAASPATGAVPGAGLAFGSVLAGASPATGAVPGADCEPLPGVACPLCCDEAFGSWDGAATSPATGVDLGAAAGVEEVDEGEELPACAGI
jgi:hypothetical protein